jgi:hypothetical protein
MIFFNINFLLHIDYKRNSKNKELPGAQEAARVASNRVYSKRTPDVLRSVISPSFAVCPTEIRPHNTDAAQTRHRSYRRQFGRRTGAHERRGVEKYMGVLAGNRASGSFLYFIACAGSFGEIAGERKEENLQIRLCSLVDVAFEIQKI